MEKENNLQAAVKHLHLVTENEPPGQLEKLFQTHHARVFRTAQRVTGNPVDAKMCCKPSFYASSKARNCTIYRKILRPIYHAQQLTLHWICFGRVIGHALLVSMRLMPNQS